MGDDCGIGLDVDSATFCADFTSDLDAGKPLTWFHLKGLMRFSERSEQGKILGLWSLEVLEHALGEHWLSTTRAGGSDLDKILSWAAYRSDFLLEIAEFALALSTFEHVRGIARVRRDLRRNATFDRFWHSRAIFQLGRQALMLGHEVAFESKMPNCASPVDVVMIPKDGPELRCEVFCISRSDSVMKENKHADRIYESMQKSASAERVVIDAQWRSMPDEPTLQGLLKQIQDLAEIVGRTGEVRGIDHDCMYAVISPAQGELGGLGNYSGPIVQGEGLERVLGKLRGKIRQTGPSGANWIFMEVNDDLWQLTRWSMEPLDVKLEMISPWMVELLRESSWCHGIVLTSGITTALLSHTEETVTALDGGYALRRCFEPGNLRVRETMIIPASLKVGYESRIWYKLLADEGDWLESALREHNLPNIDEVLSLPLIE
jgi:hypothetical protein